MQSKFSLLAILLILACQGGEKDKIEQNSDSSQVLSNELPEGFHEFYDAFHSDSLFQLEHIVFPLKGSLTRQDSMESVSVDKVYERETWKLHKPFKSDAGYERNFTVMGDLVIEKMADNMALFTVERRWGKVDTTWSLIFYGSKERSW